MAALVEDGRPTFLVRARSSAVLPEMKGSVRSFPLSSRTFALPASTASPSPGQTARGSGVVSRRASRTYRDKLVSARNSATTGIGWRRQPAVDTTRQALTDRSFQAVSSGGCVGKRYQGAGASMMTFLPTIRPVLAKNWMTWGNSGVPEPVSVISGSHVVIRKDRHHRLHDDGACHSLVDKWIVQPETLTRSRRRPSAVVPETTAGAPGDVDDPGENAAGIRG